MFYFIILKERKVQIGEDVSSNVHYHNITYSN